MCKAKNINLPDNLNELKNYQSSSTTNVNNQVENKLALKKLIFFIFNFYVHNCYILKNNDSGHVSTNNSDNEIENDIENEADNPIEDEDINEAEEKIEKFAFFYKKFSIPNIIGFI